MNVHKLTRAALIAAVYTALCLALAPFSFGAVQVRVSEALTLLVIFGPEYIVGVTVGCLLSNLLAFATMGAPPIDILVGTATTLVAAFVSYAVRNIRWKSLPVAASLPPVLFNAVVIGIELTLLYTPAAGMGMYLFNMVTVGIGQVISCCILGVGLVWLVEKNPALAKIMGAKRQAKG